MEPSGLVAPSEWDLPPGQVGKPASRASVLLWVLAGVNILFFGGCSGLFAIMAMMPVGQLRQIRPDLSAEQIAQVYSGIWPRVVLMMVLGFLPGVVYLIIAFAVRRGKLMVINLAMTIVLTQAIVTGVLLLDNIVQSVADGNPLELTLAVLILGTYVALLVYTLVWLWRARMGAYREKEST